MDKQSNENNERKYTVYLHVVPKQISGYEWDKYYVGITSRDVKERWRSGYGYYKQPFYNAVKKYGWRNMRHLILKERLTEEEACDWEINYIKIYQSRLNQHGYNLKRGGNTGKPATSETKSLISKLLKGENNPNYNKSFPKGADSPVSKIVFQFDKKGNFIKKYSYTEEVIKDGFNPACVSRACNTHTATGGYLWEHEDNVISLDDGTYIIMNYQYKEKRLTNKIVYEFNSTGKLLNIYNSAIEIDRKYNNTTNRKFSRIARGQYGHHSDPINSHYYMGNYYFYESDSDLINDFIYKAERNLLNWHDKPCATKRKVG